MTNHHRPRISSDTRDRIVEAGKRLNGADVTFHQALSLLCRYIDVLDEEVSCPTCGSEEIDIRGGGRYFCYRCDEDRDMGWFKVWDYLGTQDRDAATLPGLPIGVKYRFEVDDADGESGTNTAESSQALDSRTVEEQLNTSDPWEDGF